MSIESFGSPILSDVAFNDDGSLKQSGKQNVKFYNKKRLSFRARPLLDEEGKHVKLNGKPQFEIDPRTGIPFKDAFEETVEMVRVETKGDTNIIDDVANELHRRQFYRQYKFFREGKIPDGNPIEDFDFLQGATITELHMLGLHVIQQVAVMSDLECERLKDQSGYEIRDIAAQWVRINSPSGQAGKNARLESEVVKLRRELEEMRSAKGSAAGRMAEIMAAQEPVADEPIETMEVPQDEFAKGVRRRKSKV